MSYPTSFVCQIPFGYTLPRRLGPTFDKLYFINFYFVIVAYKFQGENSRIDFPSNKKCIICW